MKKIALLLSLCFITSEAYSQEVRYIRDVLYVPLRSGQTQQHRIVHKGLVSGTKVYVQELSEDGSYSRVSTDQGLDGWLQTQYLSDEPAGRDLYKQATKTIATLETSNTDLKQQLQQLQSENSNLVQQLTQLSTSKDQVDNELSNIKSISANAIELNTNNQQLLEENQRLTNEVDILTTEKRRLQDEKANNSFLQGAFAVLIGVIITLLIPRLWPKKRTEWA